MRIYGYHQAPSDAGSAIGCGLEYYHKDNDKKRENNTNPYLGPSYSKDELLNVFTKFDNDIYVELKLHEQIRDIISSRNYRW